MRESDILYHKPPFWISREASGHVVWRDGSTHATADSTYARTADGLSIAKARADYLAKRHGGK